MEGARLLKAAASKYGDAVAQYSIALAYIDGKGVAQDNVEAVLGLMLAAKQGNVNAQYVLGHQYRGSGGVPSRSTDGLNVVLCCVPEWFQIRPWVS